MAEVCHKKVQEAYIRERSITHDAHFYNEKPRDVYLKISQLLRLYPKSRNEETRTLIVPNNALRYSSDIMARAYSQICPTNVKRIFVITPYNKFGDNRLFLSSCDCISTPYYKIPVDRDVLNEIWKTDGCEYISRLDDEDNMGMEIQLPFITKIMEEYKDQFKIVPIYVGFIEFENLSVFANKLMPYFKDNSNIFIFSLSLTHWGSIYDFTTLNPNKKTVLGTIKEYDLCTIEALKTLKFKTFDFHLCLSKTPTPDYPTWSLFLKLTQTLLDEEEYRCRMLPDEAFFKAYQEMGELTVHGQSWSLPQLTQNQSSISFVAASLRRFFKKCWKEPPTPVNPLDKSCY